MSVEEYHAAFIKLSSQLDSMVPKSNPACKDCVARDKYEQQNKMFHFVMGLRSEFEPIRAQLLGHSTLPIMAEALSAVIAEETRLRTIDAPSFVPQHSVLATPNQYAVMDSSLISKEKAKCKHCGGKTHSEERCFKKYPHLLKEFRAKRVSLEPIILSILFILMCGILLLLLQKVVIDIMLYLLMTTLAIHGSTL